MRAWARFLVMVFATALTVQIAWSLLRPVLPAIAVVISVTALWQFWRWYRDRW